MHHNPFTDTGLEEKPIRAVKDSASGAIRFNRCPYPAICLRS